MAQEANLGVATRRAADAMVMRLGASELALRMPAPPVAGDDGEELGLRAPQFSTRILGPVALRRSVKGTEAVVAADVLEELLRLAGDEAVRVALLAIDTLQAGDESFRLRGCEPLSVGGQTCLYRLLLRREGEED